MRYKCLILDHDDTVMDSTRAIHYPAFLAALRELRPGRFLTLEEYFLLNCDPGFLEYCVDVLGFTEAEMDREYEIWQEFVKRQVPKCFAGMDVLIRAQKAAGGLVCVVSHSIRDNILRDYAANGLPEPDRVFGWEMEPDQRKPAPYPVEDIRRMFGLEREDCLVVDDLKPGLEMAERAGVPFAAAGWAHRIPAIMAFMKSGLCFDTPEALGTYLEL